MQFDLTHVITIAGGCIGITSAIFSALIIHIVLPKNKKIETIEEKIATLPTATEVASLKREMQELSKGMNSLEKAILNEIHKLSESNLKSIASLDDDFITEKEFATRVALLINRHQESCPNR